MSLEGSVKLEQEWESESEATTAPLFYAVKEEVDVGPELLQPPDVVYALQDKVKEEPKAHEQAVPDLTCSVVPEPMLVDLKSETCTIGLETHDFQLDHENQETLEISLEEYEINNKIKVKIEEEDENTSHQDISDADTREISSVNQASSTETDIGAEQTTVYEFITQSINDCKFCSHTFDTKLLLQEHEKNQHGVKYFTCFTLTENGNLKVELDTEDKLDECETTLATSSNSGGHHRTHTGEKRFKCNHCRSAFNYRRNFRKHLRKHTGEVEKFKCSICDAAFAKSNDLRLHLGTHTDEKPFKCNECDFAFDNCSSLLNHLRTHKPFKCNECDFAFDDCSSLLNHLRAHRRFKCKKCDSAFSTRDYLRIHLRTHIGEKPFKCNTCDSAFATSNGLRNHLRIHVVEKPFKCNKCRWAFSDDSSLQLHLRTHTGMTYKCGQCSSTFATADKLQIHVRKHDEDVLG